MLQEKFEIAMEPRETAFDIGSLVGQGYNILTDRSAATQVFKFDVTKTQYGIAIPKCAKFEKVQQTRSYMDQFENDESYTESRLKNLNVSMDAKPKVLMTGHRAGCNRNNYSTSSEVSFLFEQRMFEIKFGNYEEYLDKGVTFTKDFRSDVGKLPCTYDKNDPSCRSSFERFFNRFGHFLVSSAYGGGSVEVKCSREMVGSATASLAEAKAVLTEAFEGLDVHKTEFTAGTSFFGNLNTLLKRCSIFWKGGDTILREKETIAYKEKMKKWKASLLVKPAILTSEMTLEPISAAVAHVDPKKDKTIYDALKDLLGGEFKVLEEKEEQKRATEARANKIGEATRRKETVQDPNESEGACFPSSSVVNVRNLKDGAVKQKKMVKLEVGDKVMGWDEKRNRAIFTEIIMFAHRASGVMDVQYLKIALEDGNKITLSGNHLVMVGKHKKAILARKVKRGEILFTVDENRKISPKKVLAVDKVIEQGVFCPITVHGNLIVDNVLASCYASVQDHVFLEGLVKISAQSIAHFGLVPMRALHKLRLKWWRKIPNGQTIHPYLHWLCKFKLPFMAN
ncbi:sonic hedgehog [Paramuricea clavata]|uniref:Sonic hedgehog n=1 Tax=Paramuricea clavata TaxID=317549 RepID=A0A6S7IIZ6_PARCT|nr:sonic hedgehog [Paramuricea clavata]